MTDREKLEAWHWIMKRLKQMQCRMKKMQKPLTVDETFNSRWSDPNLWIEMREKETLFLMDGGTFSRKNYGKIWRCWAEKPTDEERMAAEWLK